MAKGIGGNSHQRKTVETAVERALDKRLPKEPAITPKEEKTAPLVREKVRSFLKSSITWGGIGVIFGARASSVSQWAMFFIAWFFIALAFIEVKFFQRRWLAIIGNATAALMLGAVLGLVWKLTPPPKPPPAWDQIANVVVDTWIKRVPWLSKPPDATSARTPEPGPGQDRLKSGSSTEPFVPCKYAVRFTQERRLNGFGPRPYGVHVVIFPKRINAETMPYVRFRATSEIGYGFVQGVMKTKDTGEPVAAGVRLEMDPKTGSYGVSLMGNEFAEMWIADKDKFYAAKSIGIDFEGPKPFDITCVEIPPPPQGEYILMPNGGATTTTRPQ